MALSVELDDQPGPLKDLLQARLKNFRRAAEELCVTHGAVSRHVHALEEQYRTPLLRRLPRSVAPTSEGAALAGQLTEAFRQMQQAVSRLTPGPMTLSCSATIMMKWLIPRLSAFKSANPGIEVGLNMGHSGIDFVRDKVSLAIRNSMNRPPPDAVVEPLLRRWLPSAQANRVAEWLIRIVVLYWNSESPYVDVSDPESVARFYGRHMAPGVEKILTSVNA